jgi:ankyrin repeat protein
MLGNKFGFDLRGISTENYNSDFEYKKIIDSRTNFDNFMMNMNKLPINNYPTNSWILSHIKVPVRKHAIYITNDVFMKIIENNVTDDFINVHINFRDENGLSLLKVVVYYGKIDLLKKILCNNKLIIDEDIFEFACYYGKSEIVHELLNHSKINKKFKLEDIVKLELDLFKLLLNHSKIVFTVEDLIYLVMYEYQNFAIELIKSNKVDLKFIHDDKNLLELLFHHKKFDILEYLLNNKFKFEDLPNYNKKTFDENFLSSIQNNKCFDNIIPYLDKNYKNKNGNTHLINAIIYTKNSDFIKTMLYDNFNLTDKDNFNNSLFMLTLFNDELFNIVYDKINTLSTDDKIKILNYKNNNGETLLLLAIKNIKNEVVKKLLKINEIDLNIYDNQGMSPFLYAIEHNNDEIFELLLVDKRVNVNHIAVDGNTALLYSVKNKKFDIMKRLLEHDNVDVNICDYDENNVLHYMFLEKYGVKTNDISKYGVKTNDFFKNDDEICAKYPQCFNETITNFNYAPIFDNVFDTILNFKNIDFNRINLAGNTLLMFICDKMDIPMFNKLLNNDLVDINKQNANGNTCLMYLIEKVILDLTESNKCDDRLIASCFVPDSISTKFTFSFDKVYMMINILLRHPKINVNLQNNFGYNPLIYLNMIQSNEKSKKYPFLDSDLSLTDQIFITLIKVKNIALDNQSYDGNTALMMAIQNKLWNNAKLLIEHGANTKLMNNKNKTINEIAAENGDHVKLVHILKSKQKSSWFS